MGTLRATGATRILEAAFDDPRQLAGALVPEVEPGGLFVAGDHDLTAGERVQVLVRLHGVEPGLLLSATVSWRRAGGRGGLPAGVAVRLAATESPRLEWLRAVAASDRSPRERRAPRFPVSIPVGFVLSSEPVVLSGTLLDVSEGGALLHGAPAPPPGRVVVVRLRDGRSGPPVPLRVVWTASDASGLCVLDDRSEVHRFWVRVVRVARADVEARLVRLRRSR